MRTESKVNPPAATAQATATAASSPNKAGRVSLLSKLLILLFGMILGAASMAYYTHAKQTGKLEMLSMKVPVLEHYLVPDDIDSRPPRISEIIAVIKGERSNIHSDINTTTDHPAPVDAVAR